MSDAEAMAEIDGIGVIARVTPEHKVRLVDVLKMKGHIVAMTGDGVNDAPALKKADIGIAMGITGTEVSKEAAVMILTDDDFATIVKAVELGRGLYDNLKKYIRAQMGWLFGFIFTFLGSAIFNIAGGIPFFPLQTLWVNFTVDVFQAIGLGYGKPADGLMRRKPRPANEAILPTRLLAWLVVGGLVMGVGALAVIAWATTAFPSTNDASPGRWASRRSRSRTSPSRGRRRTSPARSSAPRSCRTARSSSRRSRRSPRSSSRWTSASSSGSSTRRPSRRTSGSSASSSASLVLVVSEVRKLVWKAPLDDEPETVAAASAHGAGAAA